MRIWLLLANTKNVALYESNDGTNNLNLLQNFEIVETAISKASEFIEKGEYNSLWILAEHNLLRIIKETLGIKALGKLTKVIDRRFPYTDKDSLEGYLEFIKAF